MIKEFCFLADRHQRPDVVKQVDKQKHEDDFDQPDSHGATDVELERRR